MFTSKLKEMIRKVLSGRDEKPCKGHQLKHYFKDMHSKHIDDCENRIGCSHDCRVCKRIRASRNYAAMRVEDSMVRNLTVKVNKHNQEVKRAELAARAKRIENERLEAGRAEANHEEDQRALMAWVAEQDID